MRQICTMENLYNFYVHLTKNTVNPFDGLLIFQFDDSPVSICSVNFVNNNIILILCLFLFHFNLVYEEEESNGPSITQKRPLSVSGSLKSDIFPVASIILLYAAGCGSERLFQSMQVIIQSSRCVTCNM